MDNAQILRIENLHIDFETERGILHVLRGISLAVRQREIVAVVGESGCGKSVTAHSVMRLNPEPTARITGGSIDLCGHDIVSADEAELQTVRGALAVEPEFIVCDEAISALDISVQSHIMKLLRELKNRLGLTYLFIAHDLNRVNYLSDRIAVLYLGRVVELGGSDAVCQNPRHPYTRLLLDAVPRKHTGAARA